MYLEPLFDTCEEPAPDPPGRAMEVHGDGQPLRRAAAGATQRGGATGADAKAGLSGAGGPPTSSWVFQWRRSATLVGGRRREGARILRSPFSACPQ